jgi:hypothetical protein
MSKYIDERPFEEIVNSIVLDGKHEDYIERIIFIILADEKTDWRTNAFRGDNTMYEQEVFHLQKKKQSLQSEFDQIEKHYTAVLSKVAELGKVLSPDDNDEDEDYDEDDENDDDNYYDNDDYQGKGIVVKAKSTGMKPSEIAAKRRQDEIAYQNFKSTLATLQEELRPLMAEIRKLDKEIKRNEYYHDVSVKSLRTIRRLVKHYRDDKDIEFLKKGLYFTKNYSDMLWNRYSDN